MDSLQNFPVSLPIFIRKASWIPFLDAGKEIWIFWGGGYHSFVQCSETLDSILSSLAVHTTAWFYVPFCHLYYPKGAQMTAAFIIDYNSAICGLGN